MAKKIKKKPVGHAPGEDCNCSICIFTKSQAPGDAYDIENCPKCIDFKNKKHGKMNKM